MYFNSLTDDEIHENNYFYVVVYLIVYNYQY